MMRPAPIREPDTTTTSVPVGTAEPALMAAAVSRLANADERAPCPGRRFRHVGHGDEVDHQIQVREDPAMGADAAATTHSQEPTTCANLTDPLPPAFNLSMQPPPATTEKPHTARPKSELGSKVRMAP